ncbi:MAG: alpha-amylase [Melioribacteraceae bacterium]|nr:alpha-amylase [Melioribacteraceae bacterium]
MKLTCLLALLIINTTNLFAQSNYPTWAEGIVWYQIFPERFANGDSTNDPTVEKVFYNQNDFPENWTISDWEGNWFEAEEWNKDKNGNIKDIYYRRYGGDLQGVLNRLDYLVDLGVEAVYFNPVFDAVSLHKYDGSTFHHIDVNFGPDPELDNKVITSENATDYTSWNWTSADSLFLKLIKEFHKKNIRIIIDGVFNHSGTEFWAFKDLIKKQNKSKFADWYIVHEFDNPDTEENEFNYEGWWGIKSLPEFNRNEHDLNSEVKKYIFKSVERWMDPNGDGDPEDGVDGWRFDVAREVPLGFWNDLRKHVKGINPEAIMIGELWELSPDFVGENKPFDALMNYNFAFAVNDYMIADDSHKILLPEFLEKLEKLKITYPAHSRNLLQNLLDSHDTERLSSMIKNPNRKYDQDGGANNPEYNPGKPTGEEYNRLKFITAFQFFYEGSPMIYYGDEVGMWGADDPHCRKPMLWSDLNFANEIIDGKSSFKKGFGEYTNNQNENLLNHYKQLIKVRKTNPALRNGTTKTEYIDHKKNIFAISRKNDSQTVIGFFNNGNDIELKDFSNLLSEGKTFTEIYSLNEANVSQSLIYLPPNSVLILELL